MLDAVKDAAQENGRAPFLLNGIEFDMRSTGTKSAKYVFENEDMRFFIRSPKMRWCLSVEYGAKGLWCEGLTELRKHALKLIFAVFKPAATEEQMEDERSWQRVSVAHFAFDFHSVKFSDEMSSYEPLGRIVSTARTKEHGHVSVHGNGGKMETLTIGGKKTLQLQVYDKGKEITEISGKDWMIHLWTRGGYVPEEARPKHCWRLEIRMGSEYLKNRSILCLEDLYECFHALMAEALFSRRLTVAGTDSNRSRWKLHPLWGMAYDTLGDVQEILPLGKTVSMSGKALKEQARRGMAGWIRSILVGIDKKENIQESDIDAFGEEIKQTLLNDSEHLLKMEKAKQTYKHVSYYAPPKPPPKNIPQSNGDIRFLI
jgi:hypothetical protein